MHSVALVVYVDSVWRAESVVSENGRKKNRNSNRKICYENVVDVMKLPVGPSNQFLSHTLSRAANTLKLYAALRRVIFTQCERRIRSRDEENVAVLQKSHRHVFPHIP